MSLLNEKKTNGRKSLKNQYSKGILIINQERLKLRSNVLCYLDIWYNQEGVQLSNWKLPWPILIKWTRCSSCLSLSSKSLVLCQPAELFKQANHTPCKEPSSTLHPLAVTKPVPHSLWLFIKFFNATPVWPWVASGVLPYALFVTKSTAVNLTCPVSGVMFGHPHNSRVRIPSSPRGKKEVIKTRVYHLNKSGKIKK